ncbi:GGDEF domain-containing protein [Rhizobium sp. PAMB 3182]
MVAIVAKASIAAVLSVLASLAICFVAVPLMGGRVDGNGLIMAIVCPLLIAWPVSAFQFSQQARLRRMRNELRIAHADLKQAHRDLYERSRIDQMTGAMNRETFFATVDARSRSGGPESLVYIDVDHFKSINDTYGHHAGDEALRRIATAIRTVLDEEALWGRIGGEEFAVFLPRIGHAAACRTAEDIRASVEKLSLALDDAAVSLTVSIGLVTVSERFDIAHAAREADKRLYRAKRAGRNCIIADLDDTVAADVAASSASALAGKEVTQDVGRPALVDP